MTERIDLIRDRWTAWVHGRLHCAISDLPRDVWEDVAGNMAPFGHMWPRVVDEQIIIPACWEVLAESTDWLDEQSLLTYLDAIEFLICQHVVMLCDDENRPEEDRVQAADTDLWKVRNDAATWLLHVQAEMLDGSMS